MNRLRLLVAYTSGAMDSLGGMAPAVDAAIDACDNLNIALANSLTQVQIELVRTVRVDLEEVPDFYENVFAFAGMGLIQYMRVGYKADLAIIILNNSSMCGLPLVLDHRAEENTAYCGVDWRCMQNAQGLSHMIAHLFGAGHYPPSESDVPDDAAFPWGHAYTWNFLDSECGFTTIMGYDDYQNCCWTQIGRGPLIPYFSNPYVQYSGVPTGIDSLCDNARVIRENVDALKFLNLASNGSTSDTVGNADIAFLQGKDRVQNASKFWVKDSAMVWFRAATKISLEPGFKVEEGAYFETILDSAMLDMR